jgi:hypothetical protein
MDKHQPNHKVPYNTVQMWKNRSGIPAKWVGLILYVWLKQGHAGMAALTDSETL